MPTVQMTAPSGQGGLIQGSFGTYAPASDGSYNVDTRDAPNLLVMGMAYVKQGSASYSAPLAPAAAAIGAIVGSGTLANGTVAVTAQPDSPRPVNVEVGTGTGAITAGTVAVTYFGNDGVAGTDTLNLACPASSSVTQSLSRGVVSISAITVQGLTGGTAPWIRLSTTAALSCPVPSGTIDFAVIREYDAGATVAVGSLVTAMGSIAPTNAPNGTRTYAFVYSAVSPVS